jgi:hypothetical protein
MAFVNINIYDQRIPRKDNKLRVKLEDLVKHDRKLGRPRKRSSTSSSMSDPGRTGR